MTEKFNKELYTMNSLGPDPFVDGESSTQAHDGAEPEPW